MNPAPDPASGTAPVFGGSDSAGLALLFAAGHRPGLDQLAPEWAASAAAIDPERMEIMAAGLRFAVAGLAPAAAAATPVIAHRYGLGADAGLAGTEAVAVHPVQRVGRGDGLVPVVRALVALGADWAALPGVVAVCWSAAATAMEPRYFRRIAAAWARGGAFPGLGLTALTMTATGARSAGLALFTGFEIETSGCGAPAANARLALRAIHLLAERGGSGYDALAGISPGELRCEFTASRRLLLIRQVTGGAG